MSSIIDNQILTKLICAKDEEMFSLIKKYVKDIVEEKYEVTEEENYLLFTLRGQNKKIIMLSAHIDTVHQQKPTLINQECTLEGWKMSSENGIGGDDRSGVYAILGILFHLKKIFCTNAKIFIVYR